MSPVSRGRKGRKHKAGRRTAGGTVRQPAWFGQAADAVLADTGELVEVATVRELEARTARLLGAQLHDAVSRVGKGLWFDWWFDTLVAATQRRVAATAWQPDGAMGAWWLLHGLVAVASPASRADAVAALRRVELLLPGDAAAGEPSWLRGSADVVATGEVFRMVDVYGTRFGVLAEVRYPDEPDPAVYLFDIDASGVIRFASAGVFDDVEGAAAAWRRELGDTASAARPLPVRDSGELLCLAHVHQDGAVMGDEPRALFDHWFLAARRQWDVAMALNDQGRLLPPAVSLYGNHDVDVMATEFTGWYRDRHGTAPDEEAVGALAGEWMDGALPETRFRISPARLQAMRALIGDWIPDEVTAATLRLLPDWARWLGERSGLAEHLIDRAVEAMLEPAAG